MILHKQCWRESTKIPSLLISFQDYVSRRRDNLPNELETCGMHLLRTKEQGARMMKIPLNFRNKLLVVEVENVTFNADVN